MISFLFSFFYFYFYFYLQGQKKRSQELSSRTEGKKSRVIFSECRRPCAYRHTACRTAYNVPTICVTARPFGLPLPSVFKKCLRSLDLSLSSGTPWQLLHFSRPPNRFHRGKERFNVTVEKSGMSRDSRRNSLNLHGRTVLCFDVPGQDTSG